MSVSELGSLSTASNGRRRPSQLTNMPAFSTGGATGSTTSAARVTSLSRTSRLTTNARSSALRAVAGFGQVVDLDATDDQTTELAAWPRP